MDSSISVYVFCDIELRTKYEISRWPESGKEERDRAREREGGNIRGRDHQSERVEAETNSENNRLREEKTFFE
jgi:hypothetical protein